MVRTRIESSKVRPSYAGPFKQSVSFCAAFYNGVIVSIDKTLAFHAKKSCALDKNQKGNLQSKKAYPF